MTVYTLCRNIYFSLFLSSFVRQKYQYMPSIRFMRPRIPGTSAPFNINLELNDIYDIATNFCTKKWQQTWDTSNESRHFYSIVPSVTNKTKTTHSSRSKEVALTRSRLGKCKLYHCLYKTNLHSDGLCKECKTPEAIDHYLL